MSGRLKLLVGILIVLLLIIGFEAIYLVFLVPKPRESYALTANDKGHLENLASNMTPETKPITESTVPQALEDVNSFLITKSKAPIELTTIPALENKVVLDKLQKNDPNFILLDIRDEYELTFSRFNDYPAIQYVRFADLINDKYQKMDANKEIVVVSNSESRAYIAANYLTAQGYTNVKILKGGALQWAWDLLPLKTRTVFKYLYDVAQYHTDFEVKQLVDKEENVEVLIFAPYAQNRISIQTTDTASLLAYIDSLDKNKKYILRCDNNYYCFDAVLFWYRAKDKVSILGYTGYTPTEK